VRLKNEKNGAGGPLETYVAFLRGINVGGQKLVKMEELNRSFTALGFKNVKTLIQSGNVIFESPETPEAVLLVKIGKKLEKDLGLQVPLMLQTLSGIAALVKEDPFRMVKAGADVKRYVAFFSEDPRFHPTLPLKSPKKDLEILAATKRLAFCLAFPVGDGHYGFPNAFLESEFGVPATTRNWNTLVKLIP
jgi:uncharacterized protein (DUF1697 family)